VKREREEEEEEEEEFQSCLGLTYQEEIEKMH
jgi:hypothetical protein